MAGSFASYAQCPTISQPNQSFCDSQSPTVSLLQANANGSSVAWFATATSTTALSPTAGLNNGATYWVSNSAGTCPRQAVTVTIFGPPTGQNFQGVCEETADDATISDLNAIGNNVQWYNVSVGGTPLSPTTVLTNGQIYYASQTNPNTGCETSRLSVFVSVHLVPVPTGNPLQIFCDDPADVPTVADLQPNGTGYRWFATSSSAVPLAANTPLIDGESYYATTFDPPCESSSRLEVFVDLSPMNNAGNDGFFNVCLNELAAESPLNLFNQLSGNPDATGTWSGPLSTTGGHLGTLDLSTLTVEGSPYVFTYTATSEFCPTDTATVTINVLPLPAVTFAPNQTICSGDQATVTFTGTPNSVVSYTMNGGPVQTITLNASGTATLTQIYTTTTTITLVSVATTGANGCTATVSGSLTIEVVPLPTATISSNQTICSGQPASVTFTGTPNATIFFTVNGGPQQTIVLNASGTAVFSGTYTANTTISLVSATSAGTPACSAPLTGSITISVVPTPVVTIAADVTVCPNGQATITFTGTPNAVVTYNVNGGASQTITLNASGTASITQNYSATTVYNLISITTSGTTVCTANVSGSATVTVLPVPSATIQTSQVICPGQSATFTITGTPNATVSYTVNNGPVQTIVLDASGSASVTSVYNTSATITLTGIVTAGTPSCSAVITGSILIQVVPPPTVTIASSQTICQNDTATVTFTGTPGATVNYTVNGSPQSIVLDASGTASITQSYTTTTTYVLVSASTAGTPSCTQPVTGQVIISVVPPPTVTMASNQTICSGQQATITFTGTPNAIVTYNINGGPAQTITLNGSGSASFTNTYTATTTVNLVSVTAPGNICTQPVAQTVTITVVELPEAEIASDQTICQNETATITFTGTPNAEITYTVNGGAPNTILLDSSGTATITQTFTATTVYQLVSVSISGVANCVQPLDQSATISVVASPVATIASSQNVCPGGTATVTITGTPGATVIYTIGSGAVQTGILNASGTLSISGTYSATTVITLLTVVSPDSDTCIIIVNQSVTITVLPLPEVTIASDQSICPGASATITFTGTAGATVTYTVNGGASQTITLNASGTASVTGTYNETTVFELISAATAGMPSCENELDGTATIMVIEPPVVTIASDATICEDGFAIVTFTGTPNAIVNYTVNGSPQSVALDASGSFALGGSYSVTTVIALVSATTAGSPGCTAAQTGSVTITVIENPEVTMALDQTICTGQSATVTFTGTANTVVTYTINDGASQTITIGASGTASVTNTYTADALFQLVSIRYQSGQFCQQPLDQTVLITVVNLPVASMAISGPSVICEDTSATINFTGTPNATVTYTLNGGAPQTVVLDASGAASISPVLTENTTITLVSVSATGVTGCSQNIGTSLNITVNPAPHAGNDVPELALCESAPSQNLFDLLGPEAQVGGIWSPAMASGTGVFNPAVDPAGTYVYTVPGNSVCPPDSASVTITIVPDAEAGNNASIQICSNQDPVDLFPLLGASAQIGGTWSPALASGTGVFNPELDSAGTYTYTVLGTAPCPDDSATVAVTIVPGPDAGHDGSITLCVDSAPQDLFNALTGTPQVGGTWSPALASGTGIFNPAVDAPGVYTYIFEGTNPCDNDTAQVTVTVNPVPDAGEDGSTIFCTNYEPADLIGFLGGTPQTGGTWSPALASGTGVFDPEVDAAGVYTYTVGGGFCTEATATVTVSVVQSPNAGGGGTIATCTTTTSIDLTTGLDGTQGSGTWEDTDGTGALSGSIFNPSSVGPGSYDFTYTVGGGVSPCLFDTAVVTVVVEAAPFAGTPTGPQTVCISAGTFDLSLLLENPQPGGVWNLTSVTPAQVVENPVNLETIGAGTHQFAYVVTNSCGFASAGVQLTIAPVPVLTNANLVVSSPVCEGSAVTVSLVSMVDGTYNIFYDLSGSNTLSGQTATVTVSGGSGSFPIPSASVPNLGVTTINFTSITNSVTGCSTSLTNVLVNFTIVPLPDFDNATLSITDVCLGNDVTVTLNGATDIANGIYIFGYTLTGLTPGFTAPVSVNNGSATFTLAGSLFTTAGDYTLTLTSIDNGSGCVNSSANLSGTFELFPIPDLTGASLIAADVCVGFDGEVIISDASGLADDIYVLTYQLSGAATASGTANVDFTGGDGSFAIPSAQLPALGTVQIVIQDIEQTGSVCNPTGTISLSGFFEVGLATVPTLVEGGNLFCGRENPTVNDLSANVTGVDEVIWYGAPTGGTAYTGSEPLVQGQTYYGAGRAASGCESEIRLAVTVDLTVCNELLIPDGFSPNGDGINDEFVILNLGELYPNFKLEIYNRYGNLLYRGNISTPNWNGTASQGGVKLGDGQLPVGVYFYILEFNDGTRKPQQGRVYLSR